ncbi:MAG: undecaprenyl-phosphate glucose phosphotransferase [Thermoanaerobaculia bacterium]|nr:undecaprenyl-phosphate glucose phosphotransferase [Thermoanaerobaculia bacterium]
MIGRKHKALATTYVLLDAAGSALALLTAYYLRFVVEVIPVTKGQQELEVYTYILPLVCVIFPLTFAVHGLYRMRPAKSGPEEWVAVTIGSIVATIILSGVLLWIRPSSQAMYSRATLGLFVVCEIAFVILGRSLLRLMVERRFRAGQGLDRVLVVGGGELAQAVVRRITAHRELGLAVVGYVSHDPNRVIEGAERLGDVDDLVDVVRAKEIDHVFVAMPHQTAGKTMELLDRLIREYVSIHVVPDLMQFMALKSRVDDLDGLPTINLTESPLDGWSRFLKRGFDFVFSFVALVLFSPLMALIALAVKFEDRGPVFYRQTRMGLDGIPFEMLKFRSMSTDAETETGAVWADREDPRRTRIGRVIRAWSLDELPQLFNVLRGEMSLVGPRPERPHFVEQFRDEYPHYMLRHKVRAGITGWAQVHGWRGNTSMKMRIEHDLYYIENWSLMLDMKILLLTLRHGFRHENAY